MDIEAQASSAEKALQELKEALQSASSGTREEKLKQVAFCDRLAQRVRLSLDSYRLETRALSKEDEADHAQRLRGLEDSLRQCRTQVDWKRLEAEPPRPHLLGAGSGAASLADGDEEGGPTLEQVAQVAEHTQNATLKSVERSKKMIAQAEEQGNAILLKMNENEDKMDSIQNELMDVKENMRRNKKLLGQIMSSAKSDRCIQMLCALVGIAVMVCLVLAITGNDDGQLNVPEGVRQEGR